MSVDDIFDSVQAPSWAESLVEKNADWEEADDSFFPETAAVEEVVVQIEQLSVAEDAEDLSRMAMFGKKQQVKRRSQIRREQEQAAGQKKPEAPSVPAAIPKRPSSIPRAPSVTRTGVASATPRQPVAIRPAGPVTRSQTRAVANSTPQAPVERRGRDMTRNSTVARRSAQPSPVPNQQDFNRAVSARASSLGKGEKLPQPTPSRTIASSRPLATQDKKPAAVSSTQSVRPRVPVAVNHSPRLAFSSAIRTNPVSRLTTPSQRPTITSKPKTAPAPPPPIQRATPTRPPLTKPRTPVMAKRSSSFSRSTQPATPKTEAKVLKPRDIQGMVERLSKPKTVVARAVPTTTVDKRTVPNTYTHGMQSSLKIRSRSHSRASSRNGAAQDENIH